MVDEYLAKTLKRIFDECQEAQNRGDAKEVGSVLADEFNELLRKYQQEYPDDDVIQAIESVEREAYSKGKEVQQVKQNCLKIADILDLDTEDFREPSTTNSFAKINVEANQRVEQSITFEQVLSMVDMTMLPDDEKKELRQAVETFSEEIDKDDPDKSRLESLLDTAREHQLDVALQLGMLALQQGIDVLLGAA